jgi:membrane-associated phospholipid phosphatase
MIKQVTGKGSASSPVYAAVNVAIWGIYIALVMLVTMVFDFHTPVAVAASVLVAALMFYPSRRRAQRAAKQRFGHRPPGIDSRSRHSHA